MLYRVTLYKPRAHERGWNASDSRVVGTRRAAELEAKALLRPHARHETVYSARVTRGAFVTINTVPFGAKSPVQGRRVDTVEASLTIVPSVGDLGWTP